MERQKKSKSNIKLIQILNRCRIFLQVITLSDITDLSGKKITKNYTIGKRDPNRSSKWTWPNQNKIEPKYWKIWKNTIQTIFLDKNTLTLLHQLGQFITTPQDRSQQ